MNRLGTASGAGVFHRQSLYTSQNTWNTFLPIRHMRRRHSRIPTGALRTATWAVMAGVGSASGKDGSRGGGILVSSEAPGGTTGVILLILGSGWPSVAANGISESAGSNGAQGTGRGRDLGSGGTGGGGRYGTRASNGGWGPTEDVGGAGTASSGQRARGTGSGGMGGAGSSGAQACIDGWEADHGGIARAEGTDCRAGAGVAGVIFSGQGQRTGGLTAANGGTGSGGTGGIGNGGGGRGTAGHVSGAQGTGNGVGRAAGSNGALFGAGQRAAAAEAWAISTVTAAAATALGLGADTGSDLAVKPGRARGTGGVDTGDGAGASGADKAGGGRATGLAGIVGRAQGRGGCCLAEDFSGARGRGSSGTDVVGRCGAWVGIGDGPGSTGSVGSSGAQGRSGGGRAETNGQMTGASGGIDRAKDGSGGVGAHTDGGGALGNGMGSWGTAGSSAGAGSDNGAQMEATGGTSRAGGSGCAERAAAGGVGKTRATGSSGAGAANTGGHRSA